MGINININNANAWLLCSVGIWSKKDCWLIVDCFLAVATFPERNHRQKQINASKALLCKFVLSHRVNLILLLLSPGQLVRASPCLCGFKVTPRTHPVVDLSELVSPINPPIYSLHSAYRDIAASITVHSA